MIQFRRRQTMIQGITSILLLTILSCSSASKRTPAQESAGSTKYPISVYGGDEASFDPPAIPADSNLSSDVSVDPSRYDAVIVGGGLAGLTAALYLSDHKKSVLLLEKEPHLGGLASGDRTGTGAVYDRGAAYWTDAYEEELQILKRIGLKKYRKEYAISEPIDSYYWNGKMYPGIWDEHTLKELPASFSVFHYELKKANEEGFIPNQPFEEFSKMDLDQVDAATWIRSMPAKLAKREDPAAKEISARLQQEIESQRLTSADPMKDVVDLLELYCRSALGGQPNRISAMAFANFYISEIETRYTTPMGTGQAAQNIVKILSGRPKYVKTVTEAGVSKITPLDGAAEVRYLERGRAHAARGKFVIFAAQLRGAPKLIAGFETGAPEQARLMSDIAYSHYSVHVVEVKGHPYRLTYDTWIRTPNYTEDDFTDVILGRWMDPKIKGYEAYRDFTKNPSDDQGIMTIYHPLTPKWIGAGYTREQSIQLAERAVDRMLEIYSPLLQKTWGTKIEVQKVVTNSWPFSVHVPDPGYYTKKVKILRKPFKNVFFAHSNLGTPAFEEALFRGHCAANNVLRRENPSFQQEKWSQCPLE